nr:MAG: hypothetical protein DIU68_06445 [Chloroflexota bacterium]
MSGARGMNRTERLATIEQLLFRSSFGLRAVEIANACGVDRRTIYRDLTLLADVGVPIHQKDGRFYIDRDNYTAPIRLTFDEAVSLFLMSRIAARLSEKHNPHCTSALGKLRQALPLPLLQHLETVVDVELDKAVDLRYQTVLETITRAWGEQRRVKIWYGGEGETRLKARDFAPYFIEPDARGVLHVIGFDGSLQRVAALELRRIERARLTASMYQIPAQFDARHYLQEGWGRLTLENGEPEPVVLQFSASAAARFDERPCPAPIAIEMIADHGVRLALSVVDTDALLPWIRSWGTEVEVLEPEWLRRQFAQEAARAHALYATEAQSP